MAVAAHKPYKLYMTESRGFRAQEEIPASLFHSQLKAFYLLYHPSQASNKNMEKASSYARKKGVIALRGMLKQKYGVYFDEIDTSMDIMFAIKRCIQHFCRKYVVAETTDAIEKQKETTRRDVDEAARDYIDLVRTKGLYKLDKLLKEKFSISLSEFRGQRLHRWKNTWKVVLQDVQSDRATYELERFYAALSAAKAAKRSKVSNGSRADVPGKTPVQALKEKKMLESLRTIQTVKNLKIVEPKATRDQSPKWDQQQSARSARRQQEKEELAKYQLEHTRDEMNEKLLEKYNMSLDDVKMIKGATKQQRIITLQRQLTEFYQLYDPASRTPKQTEPKASAVSIENQSSTPESFYSSQKSGVSHFSLFPVNSADKKVIDPWPIHLSFTESQKKSSFGLRRKASRKGSRKECKLRQFESTGNLMKMRNVIKEVQNPMFEGNDEVKEPEKEEHDEREGFMVTQRSKSSPEPPAKLDYFESHMNIKLDNQNKRNALVPNHKPSGSKPNFNIAVFQSSPDLPEAHGTPRALGSFRVREMKEKELRENVLTEDQLREIEVYAEKGVIELENLNAMLMTKFQANLETMAKDKLMSRLLFFYKSRGVEKEKEKVEHVALYGLTRGLKKLNKKLMLTHGTGIKIEDLLE